MGENKKDARGEFMFLYETHCHTKSVSACASLTAEELVEVYLANGYSGVFITEHFLNGNTTLHRLLPEADYREKITAFCASYEEVKRVAGTRLQVFFGFEYSYEGTDILVYGWDESKLKKMEKILSMSMREFCEFCRENSALAIQAHPFREAGYIDHIRLFTQAEGIETYNSARDERCNRLADFFAEEYGKIKIGGSDMHTSHMGNLSGMAFDTPLHDEQDFIERLRAGEGKIIRQKNCYKTE